MDKLITSKVESKGYGIIYKLPMQDKDLDVVAKTFYAYICSFAGAGDTAFPGMDKICSDLGVSRQRLERHRKALVEKGYITINQIKEQGRFARNEYKINKELVPLLQNATTEKPTTDIPTTENITINNNIFNNNNINNNNINKEDIVTSKEVTKVKSNQQGINEILELYKTLTNLPQYKKITGARLSSINARLEEDCTVDELKEILIRMNNTAYFKKSDKNGWFTFDWTFKPDNFAKIIEGKYWNLDFDKNINNNKEEKKDSLSIMFNKVKNIYAGGYGNEISGSTSNRIPFSENDSSL